MCTELGLSDWSALTSATIDLAEARSVQLLDYYARLEVAELEGDMLKASRAGDWQKLAAKYEKLVRARAALAASEAGPA